MSSNERLPDPDHDRRAELHDRHAAFPQDLTGLNPASEVLAERCLTGREAAEVDDSPHPCAPRRFAEVAGRDPILFQVVAVGAHGVHEVVGDVDAGKRAVE